jgi:amidase
LISHYLNKYASDEITIRSISEIIAYNNNDSLSEFLTGKDVLKKCYQKIVVKVQFQTKKEGVNYFENQWYQHAINAITSQHHLPARYKDRRAMGLTFIARPYQEDTLLWICL